nr:YtxH domain-containing protein [Saprospiraceae bacterium]
MGKKKKNNGNAVVWALAGLGAGLAISLLITPERGEVMRNRIKNKAVGKLDDFLESVESTLEKAYDKAMAEEASSNNNS